MFDEQQIHEHSANQMWLIGKLSKESTHWTDVVEGLQTERGMNMSDALTLIMTGLQTGALVFTENSVGYLETYLPDNMSPIEAEFRILTTSERMKEIVRRNKEPE